MSKKSESASRGDSLDAEMTSLKVAVRVRPLNDKEINLGSKIVVDVHGNDIVITDLKVPEHQGYDHRSRVHKFSFDYGFSSVDPESVQYASQTTVFENFGRVVLQALLEGYNCCVIAYGQSGSGKTYTMMGMKDEEGLTPRICEGLLMKLEDKAKQNISFAVNISYMEIYNEQVYDLLQKPDERTNLSKPRLRVREHPIHGPFVEGLSTHVLRSRDNVCQLISEGNNNRVKAATYIHDRSSRSHAIFTVHCSQACLDESQPKEVVSKLQLVDLAGSEKAGHEFCQSRLKEGANINKSLVTLGNVISALVELSQRSQNGSCKSGKQLFVPYRDSQLTWLMKDSLGGNSHTFMLAAVSPSNECYSETLSTLRYAQRAKSVLSTPIVNEDPATKIIRNLRLEVNKLKSLLINADVLSKKAIIEPLTNISHLNFIMKKSEKKVDHLTRCWLEKWLETYNAVLKKTCHTNEGSSTLTKGTDVPQLESIASNSTAERTDTIQHECDISVNSGGTLCGNSVMLKAGDSDAILSDKSSSVSSECIILPNETIFYSKGKRTHGLQNYFKDCASYLKSASLNNVNDSKCEFTPPPDKSVKDSSNPEFHIQSSSLSDVSYCRNTFKSPPVLNSVSVPNVCSSVSLHDSLLISFSLPQGIQELSESIKSRKESETEDTDFLESSIGTNNCFEGTCEEKKTCHSSQVISPTDNHSDHHGIYEEDPEVKSSNEFSQNVIRSHTSKSFPNTPDYSISRIHTDDKTLIPFLLPKGIQTLSESNKTTKESETEDTDFLESSVGKNNCFEETCEKKKTCHSSQVISPTDNHSDDYGIYEEGAQVKSNNEFSQYEIRSHTSKGFASTPNHSISRIQTDDETLHANGSEGKNCTDGFSASNSLTHCMINTTDKIHSCREVEFNDSVTEESDNFVKLLNQLQDGSVETISRCFQRKDSEILSLLSLSSNDYPPFNSLDDIFNDDMEVSDETGSIGFDGSCESKDKCMSWNEIHSSSDVSDLSESSDAESEFDYVDFTKNTTGTCSKKEICIDSSAVIMSDEQQNLQNSEFLRHIKRCKANMLSIPENAAVPQTSINSEASAFCAAESYPAKNKYIDVNGGKRTVTAGYKTKLESENSVDTEEVSQELSPVMCTNVHTDNFSVLCSKNLTSSSRHHTNESVNSMKIPDNRDVENFTTHAQNSPVLHKRLCTSDSILKTSPSSETKYSSKSDNTVYTTPEQCSIAPAVSAGSNREGSKTLYENVNNNSITKTLFRNKDSISDLLGFSVQDILEMISSKNLAQCSAVLKKQIYPTSEERLQYDNAIPEEIQSFIDSTEITDANKLADELLKKKLPQCSTSATLTNNDSEWADYDNRNKLTSKSKLCSHAEGANCMSCGEKSGYQNLDTDMCRLSVRNHSQTEKVNKEKKVSVAEKSNDITPNAQTTDVVHKIGNVKCTEEVKVDAFNNSEENGRFKHDKLHMAVEKVHCEKENALEYFTFNGSKEILLGSLSDESDYLDNAADSIKEIKKPPKSQQISVASSKSGASEIMPSPHSVEGDTVQIRSDFQNFLTESPDDNITDGNSEAKTFAEYSTFGNLNITGLAPIQEEAADEDDDVISESSEDESPNISFQFDSLERPKNMSVVKKDSMCVEQSRETNTLIDSKDNEKELHKSDNLSSILNDVSKIYYNKNYDLPAETEKQDRNKELSNLYFNHAKCIQISKETVNPKDMLRFCSIPIFEKNLRKSAVDTCKLAVEFQDSQKCPSSFITENYDRCNIIGEEMNKDVELPKNNFQMNNSEEVNNLPNQLCSWDSMSSSTSSDSITFVFVGKENKDAISETNSRSFQSSLFSSVSLDSLEKSSVHQNQVACASPRTLSIDSLVAEELLFQLRNSDPVQALTSEIKQNVGNKCEVNNAILTDQKLAPQKTNFAATSQLSSNQHLKMYHHIHCNVENDMSAHDATTEILGMETSEKQNAGHDTTRNQIVTYHSNTFPSGSYCANKGDNKFQNLRKNYSCISPESNGDVTEQTCSYLKTGNSKEHHVAANARYSVSNDCNKENISSNIHMCEMQKCISEENVFNTCANGSHFDCIEFKNQYALDLQSNSSNVALDNCNITDDKSLEPVIVDNYGVMQKQIYLPENLCSKSSSFCNKRVTNDCSELISVKELTEENLKIFNLESEENQEENFILPPPSTFGGSEDNDLSVISNCSSLANNQSKTSVDVFSKSTQTDKNIQNYCNKAGENNTVMDSGNTDLIERMMDLMAETLKLMKEQYSKTSKRSHSHTRRKLNFSTDSDKNMPDLKQKTVVPHTASKQRKYLSKERTADSKVLKYIQSVLPLDNESDYAIENFGNPLAHSEVSPYPQKTVNEKCVGMRSKVVSHGDQKIGCSMGKQPNFYTLPFDFITCKYQCKKLSNASKLKKPDTFSRTSVNYLPDKTKNLNSVSNELDNISSFQSLSAKVSGINEMASLKQSLPKPGTSKSHLKHLIELRRQVVEATTASPNVRENVNSESQVTDPLKSSSSSSEGYLSSVSSRGPFRHLSEASTDSQEFSCTAERLFQRQRFPKHSVKPLDFSTHCDKDVAVSPDTRWLNTSADSGAFFLDSPGTEKKANLDEYPTTTTSIGATSSATCSSPKRHETRSPLHCNDTATASINPQEAKVPSFSRFRWDEIKNGRRQHDNDFAPGFQELDEIGENYLDILSRKTVSINSSISSDLSLCTEKSPKNRNPKSSRTSRNSPQLKHVSSQEIQRLLESIENDRRLLQQLQHNHVFDKKYLPSSILPSCSSLEITDDLFYQDTYKSLPAPHGCLNSSASHKV